MRVSNPIAKLGEDLATKYLQKLGFKVIERNFRKGYGEIDIVSIDSSEKSPILCFAEVKTRTSNEFGTPLEAIAPWKLHSLIKTAEFYKLIHKNFPDTMRIDAVSVLLHPDETVKEIELVKNISGW